MFKIGDKVELSLEARGVLIGYVYDMLYGKIGTITENDDEFWDYIVHFEGTEREGGMFGMDASALRELSS